MAEGLACNRIRTQYALPSCLLECMSVNPNKKLRWFDRGAEALERQFPGLVGRFMGADHPLMYACPICLTAYGRAAVQAGLLTAEDVPPQSLGGRPLVLTCHRCNSTAGTKIDAHARRRENMREVVGGLQVGARRDVRLTVDDYTVQATASNDGSTIHFDVPARINRPGVPYEVLRLVQAEEKPIKVTYTETPWSEFSASICWLKSAYLALFAAAGYTVVFAPAMQSVREQILHPQTRRIARWGLELPEDVPPSFRRIAKIESPEWQRGWFMQIGRHVVVLPNPNDVTFFARVAAARGMHTYSGREYEWPTEPTFGPQLP